MLIALALAACLSNPTSIEDVFVSQSIDPKQPFQTFRIPALCRTRKGTLLAFAEGRQSINDQASNVIVLKRRQPGAAGWSGVEVVVRDEPASLNNPCVVAARSGRVWMMYQRYPAGLSERTVDPGFEPERTCRTYVVSSDDEGSTWSKPRELTNVVKRDGIRSLASGPGIGIEMQRGSHKGRLIFPFNEGAKGAWTSFPAFSDDGGRTWHRGESVPKALGTQPNETQFVELVDGTIMLNARNQAAGRYRLTCRSANCGATWTTAQPDLDLPDPVCMGSIARLSFKPDLIAFSNPANTSKRENGVLRLSRDGGKSWAIGSVVTTGSFGYSCLCPLSPSKVGILYESIDRLANGGEGYRLRYAVLDVSN